MLFTGSKYIALLTVFFPKIYSQRINSFYYFEQLFANRTAIFIHIRVFYNCHLQPPILPARRGFLGISFPSIERVNILLLIISTLQLRMYASEVLLTSSSGPPDRIMHDGILYNFFAL
jgi:hypothetical protein